MKIIPLLPLMAALSVCLPVSATLAAKASEQTLRNLNVAFRGEANAANRYAEFAKQADQEGYPQVARLFRAASAAEAIHRETHQKAILAEGGKPDTFQLDAVVVNGTAENLRAAIQGEITERDTMYPEFLAEAKAVDARAAIRTFEFARAAEKEHALLYQSALGNLGKSSATDYYVCQVCGMTLTELPAKKCPSCRKSRDEYKKVS
jgi:rubrerythrin